MNKTILLTIFIFCFIVNNVSAQDIIVYQKPKSTVTRLHFSEVYFLPAFTDTAKNGKLFQHAVSVKEKCKGYPDLNGMLLFNSDPTTLFNEKKQPGIFRQLENFPPGYGWCPPSFRFYTDSSHCYFDSLDNLVYYIDLEPEKYLLPFYLSKFEVTNKEYKQFVEWVRDSIARYELAKKGQKEFLLEGEVNEKGELVNFKLNRKTKLDWGNKDLREIFFVERETRLYVQEVFLTEKLNFSWISEDGTNQTVSVYPDTLCWVNDFTYSYNEPLTNMYYWHPAYDAYPVVGVSYEQARAFLHWKTVEQNKILAAQKRNYRVVYDLPTEIEWEIASAGFPGKEFPSSFNEIGFHLYDHSWVCDLSTCMNDHYKKKSSAGEVTAESGTMMMDLLYKNSHYHDRYFGNYVVNGAFHTAPVYISSATSNYSISRTNSNSRKTVEFSNTQTDLDPNGICYMGGNVSEWLKEDYEKFRGALSWRMRYLERLKQDDANAQALTEKHFAFSNSFNGKLIRGGNWEDERLSCRFGKNIAGISAKKFIDPKEKHSTVGFRCVAHLVFID